MGLRYYVRHGTTTSFATFGTATGQMIAYLKNSDHYYEYLQFIEQVGLHIRPDPDTSLERIHLVILKRRTLYLEG